VLIYAQILCDLRLLLRCVILLLTVHEHRPFHPTPSTVPSALRYPISVLRVCNLANTLEFEVAGFLRLAYLIEIKHADELFLDPETAA